MQNKQWFNQPQKLAMLSLCKEEYGVWGRGTGKTQGPIAYRSIFGANSMPRGATGILGTTYTQLLDRTLPPLIKSWEKFGYRENKHFWVRKFPPASFNIPKAIYPILQPAYGIFWWNGHVFHLISQDKPGLANSKNLDAVIADEARFLNHQRYMDDLAPANRGNLEYFGHLPHHHMVTMYTDMPTNVSGKWILEKEQQMNVKLVNEIIAVQLNYNKNLIKIKQPGITIKQKNYLATELTNDQSALSFMRQGSVYYSEASSLDNIEILGEEQIKQWRREMMWTQFQSSILNKRVIHTEQAFYNLFDEYKHTYISENTDYLEQVTDLSAINHYKRDGDVISNKPLDIAFDYGSHINCMVIGQEQRNFFRIIKGMYVKGEKRLNDLIDEFVKYYEPHQKKEVNYYYDHTAQVTDTTRVKRISDVVIKAFADAGWKVNGINIGQQPRHETRHRLFQNVFSEHDPNAYRPIRFNAENCRELILSIQQAGVLQGKNGFEKDKRSERNSSFAQEEATHFTDALDTLYIGRFKHAYGLEIPTLSVVM
jgi:hypothetical protein